MVCVREEASHRIQGVCFKQISIQSDQTGYNYCLILCLGLGEFRLGSGLLTTWFGVMFLSVGSAHELIDMEARLFEDPWLGSS